MKNPIPTLLITSTIKALDGFEISLGQRVDFITSGDTRGTGRVADIIGDRVYLDVIRVVHQGCDRWDLTEEEAMATGRLEFFSPRDEGVRISNLRRPGEIWEGF